MNKRQGHLRSKKARGRLPGIAPDALIREDMERFEAKTLLRCTNDVEKLILIQSVESHAHGGHGVFHGKNYPNTTQEDIAEALRLEDTAVKSVRQELIDDIFSFAKRLVDGDDVAGYVDCEDEPLLGCGMLRYYPVDAHGFLTGLYLGGLRDCVCVRQQAKQKYGIEIGYGKKHIIDKRMLEKLDISGYELARKSNEDKIDFFREAGLISESEHRDTALMFVRYSEGMGASDDAAIIICGLMYGVSAAIGCFFADAIDTLEKYAVLKTDQDESLARYVEKNYTGLHVDEADSARLAYLCAIEEDRRYETPDSSLRHLLEVDRTCDQCAIESHLAFVANNGFSEMELDRGQTTNTDFYEHIARKVARHQK